MIDGLKITQRRRRGQARFSLKRQAGHHVGLPVANSVGGDDLFGVGFPSARGRPVSDKPIELWIDVPPEIKLAIERAAAERGLSVAEFLQEAMRKHLVDTGYLENRRSTPY